MTERHKTRKHIRIIVIFFLVFLVVGYTLYEIRQAVSGPSIIVFSPQNGETIATGTITITGIAKNIAAISLDGRNIFVDQEGNFTDEMLLSPGYNAIELDASDRFGSKTEKVIEIMYK